MVPMTITPGNGPPPCGRARMPPPLCPPSRGTRISVTSMLRAPEWLVPGHLVGRDLHLLGHAAHGFVVSVDDQVGEPLILFAPVAQRVAMPRLAQMRRRKPRLPVPDLQRSLHVLLLRQRHR